MARWSVPWVSLGAGPESSDRGLCILPCAARRGGRPAREGEENPRMRQSDRYNPEQYFLTCLAIMGSVCQLEYVQREGFAEPSRSGMRVTPEPAGC